ncbi:hypothetical protein PR048_003105 [Dryococelus australis]|uniref:HAT C-terminal dimerisation domain-containing protein n=1 Tax=Dryococelus australis TaxID=614101 RepID=A0ABQ9IM34_9NEOP|nr:hypothetical protein PR048_003105 [Dryococelus australis]
MGLQNIKNYIIHHLDAYYSIEATETNRFYALATCLDPRQQQNQFGHAYRRSKNQLQPVFQCTLPSLSSQSPAEGEVKNYLDEPLTPDEDTVFQYWETAPYPILKRLASKYLCVPAGTVASEQLFSTCGSFLNNRCSLKPEKLRMLVFLKKNLKC